MSRSGLEALQAIGSGWEAILEVREWSGGHPGCLAGVEYPLGCPGVVGMSSRRSGGGREVHAEVREWSGGFPGNWEWSASPSRCPGVVGRPSRKSWRGQ